MTTQLDICVERAVQVDAEDFDWDVVEEIGQESAMAPDYLYLRLLGILPEMAKARHWREEDGTGCWEWTCQNSPFLIEGQNSGHFRISVRILGVKNEFRRS